MKVRFLTTPFSKEEKRKKMSSFFIYENLALNYEPFPIGIFQPAIPKEIYSDLCDQFPPIELFDYKEHLGHKYSLSEINNPTQYYAFLESNPLWNKFYKYIKSPEFIVEVVRLLERHNIKMNLIPTDDISAWNHKQKISHFFRSISKNKIKLAQHNLKTRFEFSALPADKGSIKPHTDSPTKLITLVLTMLKENEWDKSWGGGTDSVKPKDITKYFNQLNQQLDFSEVEVMESYDFNPNQCLLFVKTFNSWHSVSPIRGPKGVIRKTLTINIETY